MFGRLLPYDFNAQQYLSAAKISDPTIVSAVNELVLNLKGGGVWDYLGAVYPFIGGTAGPCAVNLVNPGTFDLSFTGVWTFTSTYGQVTTNVTWADTGINDNTFNNTGNGANIHLSAVVSYETELDGYPIGVRSTPAGGTAQGTWLGFETPGDEFFAQARGRSNQQVAIAGANTSNFFLVTRAPVSVSQIYYQIGETGATAANNNEGAVGGNTATYLVGSRRFGADGQGQQFNGYIEFVTIGSGLTGGPAIALYNAIKKFNQKVGKTAI